MIRAAIAGSRRFLAAVRKRIHLLTSGPGYDPVYSHLKRVSKLAAKKSDNEESEYCDKTNLHHERKDRTVKALV